MLPSRSKAYQPPLILLDQKNVPSIPTLYPGPDQNTIKCLLVFLLLGAWVLGTPKTKLFYVCSVLWPIMLNCLNDSAASTPLRALSTFGDLSVLHNPLIAFVYCWLYLSIFYFSIRLFYFL